MSATTQVSPKLLTAEELSEQTSIPPFTIRRLHRQGKIPVVDLGRRTKRYILEDVLSAIEKQTRRETVKGFAQ